MEGVELSLLTGGFVLAGAIKGATGLGFASCALPFLASSVGLEQAMCLIALPTLLTNVGAALSTRHLWETTQRFRWLYLSMLPGVAAGIWLLLCVDRQWALRGLSLSIISYSVFALCKPGLSIPQRHSGWLQIPAGFLNGVFTGLTGAQVMPLLPFVMSLRLDDERTVQTINLAVAIASTILTIALFSTGLLTPELMAISAVAVIPAMLGVRIGLSLRKALPHTYFRTIVLIVLLVLGAQMWPQPH